MDENLTTRIDPRWINLTSSSTKPNPSRNHQLISLWVLINVVSPLWIGGRFKRKKSGCLTPTFIEPIFDVTRLEKDSNHTLVLSCTRDNSWVEEKAWEGVRPTLVWLSILAIDESEAWWGLSIGRILGIVSPRGLRRYIKKTSRGKVLEGRLIYIEKEGVGFEDGWGRRDMQKRGEGEK